MASDLIGSPLSQLGRPYAVARNFLQTHEIVNLLENSTVRVLVSGSSGQLGRVLTRELRKRGSEVRGLDLRDSPTTTHCLDIRDHESLHRALKGMDAVIHIASLHAPHVGCCRREEFIHTNISGTLGLLEAAVAANVRRFVYTSTTSVYGFSLVAMNQAVWVTEATPAQPRDIYDISKLAAEQLCLDVGRESGLSVVCLRVCRFFDEPAEIVARYRLYRGADVRDIARAHVLAIEAGGISGEILNIAGPYPFHEHDIAQLLRDAPSVIRRYLPGVEIAFEELRWQLPKTIDRVYSSEAAERILGYRPQFGLTEFLSEHKLG